MPVATNRPKPMAIIQSNVRTMGAGDDESSSPGRLGAKVTKPMTEGRKAQEAQREGVMNKLSSFFGEEGETCDTCNTCNSPTSVLHLCKQEVYGDDDKHELEHENDENDKHFKPPKSSLKQFGSSSSVSKNDENDKHFKPPKSSLKQVGSSPSVNRSVSFSSLNIREYNVQIGDNPCCSYGLPISLGWDYEEHDPQSIDDFQEAPRRERHELVLSYYDRRIMLKDAGYSGDELRQCLRAVNQTKHERGLTELFLATAPLEDAIETVVRGVKSLFYKRPADIY